MHLLVNLGKMGLGSDGICGSVFADNWHNGKCHKLYRVNNVEIVLWFSADYVHIRLIDGLKLLIRI